MFSWRYKEGITTFRPKTNALSGTKCVKKWTSMTANNCHQYNKITVNVAQELISKKLKTTICQSDVKMRV